MANEFYNEGFQGQAGQTARAEHVKTELAAIGSAFDAVEGLFNRALIVPDEEGAPPLARLPEVAARRGRFLRFDEAGQPEAVQSGFTWRGAYQAGAVYSVGDVFTYGPYSSIYITTVAHVAPASGNLQAGVADVMVNLQGLNVIRNELVTASRAMAPGGDYLVDCSGSDVVLTLPASVSITDAPINITHVKGGLGAGQRLTVARNGHRIMGLAEDLQVDTANASFSLMYANAELGFRLRVLA